MKKIPFSVLCAFVVSPLLVQCASQDDLNQIHYQLRMLNKKVTDLESTTLDDLQKRQAMSVNQIDRLQQDLLELRSGLEETGHLNRRLNEQSKELETAFRNYTREEEEKRQTEMQRLEQEISQKDQQLEKLADQIKSQQENLQAIQQARVEEAKRKAAAAAQAAEEARQRATTAASSSSTGSASTVRADKAKKVLAPIAVETATPTAEEPQRQAAAASPPPESTTTSGDAAKGKSLFDQGKYREAYKVFEGLAKSSDTTEAVEARYMMGESLFALKEFDQAILDYQTIITNYPSSAKAPTAMYRQALAFESLNDKDTAKILYKKLIASYKDSPEAAQAQQKLGSN
jgi:tol-pal system protein YbgF